MFMKKLFKKAVVLALVGVISGGSACILKEQKTQEAEAWVGIGYAATKKGAGAEAQLLVSAIGLWESSLQGAAIGSAISPGVGTVVGILVGC